MCENRKRGGLLWDFPEWFIIFVWFYTAEVVMTFGCSLDRLLDGVKINHYIGIVDF